MNRKEAFMFGMGFILGREIRADWEESVDVIKVISAD